jgi:CBS domain-containing protein
VGEIVHTNVRTVSPAEFIDVAAAVFVGLKIGCLPVVEDGRLTGIVTEMDLLAAFDHMCRKGRLDPKENPMVSACMTPKVTAATVNTSLQDAFSICFSRGIRHLPVLDGDVIAGVVSDRDLRAAANSAHPESIRLADIMASQLEVVEPEARLSEAARQMVDQKVTTLPVMQGDQLLGMLSLSDVLSHCVTALRNV